MRGKNSHEIARKRRFIALNRHTQKQAKAFWTIETPTKSKSKLFAWRFEVFLQICGSEL
jgi:hypothetical protein